MKHRYFSWANPKPNPITFGLSKVHGLIYKTERRLGFSAQSKLVNRLRSLLEDDDADKLVALILFFRQLPLEFGVEGFENQLDGLMGECLTSSRISAVRRLNSVVRCVAWSYANNACGSDPAGLRKHAWPLLLEVAEENVQIAVQLVDEHWNKTRPPEILMTLHLHERPELAYKLAAKLKPYRADFSADVLRYLVFDASFQIKKMDQSVAGILGKVVDTSCQLLATWIFEKSWTSPKSALLSIDRLLQFGDPHADYWSKLVPEGLSILQTLPLKELDLQLRLLAQVVFYSENPVLARDALDLFKNCVRRRLSLQGNEEWTAISAIRDISQSLSILEDKIMCMRNKDIAAKPAHPLLHVVEAEVQNFLGELLKIEPDAALRKIVSLTLQLSNETLIRKHHRILQDEFAVRATEHPVDAGLALKSLIQYCGYSQMDDEVYRKDLCKQSFNVLLPHLETISPTDAAVARTGIGWSPRGDI